LQKKNGCLTCITCKQIKEHQHHGTLWLYPEKHYTKDQFDPVFKTISFALETNELFFIVIQKADFLTASSANRLLKPLEEPPSGYHFILLAERADQLLPTIISRCIVHHYASEQKEKNHPLFDYFSSRTFHDPSLFLKQLDQSKINERETIELLDALMRHWTTFYRQAVQESNMKKEQDASLVIQALKEAFKHPPMPGSSKVFWKNLYLQMR